MRILKSNSLLRLYNSYVVDSPQPANISYMWNFGSLLARFWSLAESEPQERAPSYDRFSTSVAAPGQCSSIPDRGAPFWGALENCVCRGSRRQSIIINHKSGRSAIGAVHWTFKISAEPRFFESSLITIDVYCSKTGIVVSQYSTTRVRPSLR